MMMTWLICNPSFEWIAGEWVLEEGSLHAVPSSGVLLAKGGRGGGGGGGGPQTVTQTSTSTPWAPQAPYLQEIVRRAQEQSEIPSYVEPSPLTREAEQAVEARARAGSPLVTGMQQELGRNIQGDYLYGGPGFTAAVEAAQRQVLPQVQSQFGRAGRAGSGLAREAQTRALADVFAQQYGDERQRQMRAMAAAPAGAELDFTDIGRLADLGEAQELREMQQLQDPRARLRDYLAMVGGTFGSTGSQTIDQPGGIRGGGFSAPGFLGGALGGARMMSGMGGAFGGPWGMGLGALGGGLLGGLF